MLPADIVFRPASAADTPALVELINAAFAVEKGKFKTQERIVGRELDGYFARGEFLVACRQRDSGELLACVFVEILSPPTEGRAGGVAYFGLLSVDPKHQRSGLGREMTLQAEAWGVTRGCRAMELETLDVRPELPPVYERMGYRTVSIRPSPVPERFTQPVQFIRMRKALNPNA